MVDNKALKKIIEECDRGNAIIISIDYINNRGLIEQSNGTPTTIYYDEEKEEWR